MADLQEEGLLEPRQARPVFGGELLEQAWRRIWFPQYKDPVMIDDARPLILN